MIGTTISHYKILEKLGGGGMGVVYKAEDIKLKRAVALKFLPPELTRDEDAKQRFIHEAQAASALDHANICTVYEIGETDEAQLFIAMAYYDGETLKKKIEQGALKIDEVIDLAIQIAQGLAAAHEADIIHRDIKPANVMLTNKDVAKIVDFGLAKAAGQTMLTKEGITLGTIAYMSPEQTHGAELDHRSDIWSLGVIYYEMLTGELPFKGHYDQAVVYSIMNEEPQPMTDLREDVSPVMVNIVNKALAKRLEQRYQTAAELIADLESLKTGTISAAGPTPMVASDQEEKSIAVVDFTNITEDASVDWLSSGIAETVTVDLKKVSALKVVSREKLLRVLNSITEEKITQEKIIDLGKKLQVRWIISGGYQKLGNKIRITAHFTEISIGDVIGSTKADGTLEDIFKLQDQIITNLMETLQVEVSDSEVNKMETPETIELEAYEYYAKGKQLFIQFGKESFEQATEYFEKAVEIDPKYALAYSGLGSIHIFRFIEKTDPTDLDIGLSHLQKAIKYDPDLADTYLWLTYAYMRKQRLEEAVQSGQKALQLEPDNPLAHYFMGSSYQLQGAMEYKDNRYRKAVQHYKRNNELQPNFQPPYMSLAWIYILHGQYPKAHKHLEKAIEIEESGKSEDVKFIGALTMMGNLHFRQQQLDEAVDCYERALEILEKVNHLYKHQFVVWTYCGIGDIHLNLRANDKALQNYKSACGLIDKNPKAIGMGYCFVRGHLGMAKAFWKLGMKREAKEWSEEALKLISDKKGFDFNWIWEGSDTQAYYDIASYNALTNRYEEAIKYLRKAVDCSWGDVLFLEADESFDSVRRKAEYQKIVKKLKNRKPLS